MMRLLIPRDLTSQEYRRFLLPTAIAGLLVLLVFLLNILAAGDLTAETKRPIILLIFAWAMYITVYSFYLIPARNNKDALIWINAILSGLGFWIMALYIPDQWILYQNLLLFLSVISVSVYSGRWPTLVMIALGTFSHLAYHLETIITFLGWTEHIGVPLVCILLNETVNRIQNTTRGQIHRLEIINDFSRQVSGTLDREQILAHLNIAIPNTLICDSYYISEVVGDEVHVLKCYDDGEYFDDVRVPAEGTLTNWVVQNQSELFLPDLRQPINLENIKIIIVGKAKTSLSWIGVPMISSKFKGVLALASYEPNAFNRGDLELLSNLAQHAALAFENAARHAEVEERARLDSMTGVLNHGHFLQTLQIHSDHARAAREPLGLIMLDVDHFKRYNDTHGHLVGDQILIQLCDAIRSNIKSTDAVGRWGGEEFIISLPGAGSAQAKAVAERIGGKMRTLRLTGREGDEIAAPTVSQGIAVLTKEIRTIFELIDLADRRLYRAKSRGRDQIEPAPD